MRDIYSATICAALLATAIAGYAEDTVTEGKPAASGSRAVLRFVECADENPEETLLARGTGAPVGVTGPDICDDSSVEKAEVSFSESGESVVLIHFTPEGGKAFSRATKRLVGKKIAVIFKGEVISCPMVMEEISGGRVQIMGGMTAAEAEEIAKAINGGKNRNKGK